MHFLLLLVLSFDLASVKTEPNLERRSELAIDNAAAALDTARDAYKNGDIEKTRAALDEVRESVDLSYRSLQDSGKDARRNPKFFKRAELRTRDLLRRLDHMVTAATLDDKPLIESVRNRVGEIHDALIQDIMKKK